MEFDGIDAACHDAQVAVTEMAREVVPGSSTARIGVEIDDDESGKRIYRASLKFEGKTGDLPADDAPARDTASELPNGPRD